MIIESESKKSKIKITYKHVAVKLSFCLICGLWWCTNAIYIFIQVPIVLDLFLSMKRYSSKFPCLFKVLTCS